ncbi:ApaG protein [Acidiphilium sp. MT5]|jgi:ApaG protein
MACQTAPQIMLDENMLVENQPRAYSRAIMTSNKQPHREADRSSGYVAETAGIRVAVRSFFLADQSRPDQQHFIWAYRVRIENRSNLAVQLLARTWRITDARGAVQIVHGDGVIGEQPVLDPGESFEYTSGTPLKTPSGFMTGHYHMIVADSGEKFDVAIPPFSLDSPFDLHQLH